MTIEIGRGEVLVVERGYRRRRVPGSGLLDSMTVVWKHWRESFRKNRDFSDIHGTFTEQYPEERPRLPEAYRNMPILLYDDASGHELCTSCFQCQRICPPQVIHMTQAKDPATGKAVPAVAEFVIEYDACMSCGFCAEVCPFDAIKMDHAFELSTADHPSLTVHKEALNRPVSYYAGIAPLLWAEVESGAMKKLQGNIKRRPDVLGMAPNLVEKLAARRRELAAAAAAAPPAAVAPAPAAPAEGAGPAQSGRLTTEGAGVAPGGRLTAEEKAAKLAAIKAANAAKAAGGSPPPPTAEVPAPTPAAPAPPADEKAARLAAIRAKNAAGRGEATSPPTDGATPPPTDGATPADETATGRGGATSPPADEKAARLAAIRAKNAVAKGEAPPNRESPEGS